MSADKRPEAVKYWAKVATEKKKRAEAVRRLQQPNPPTRAAVARDLGVPPSTVKYWAKVAGFPPGSPGRPPRHGEKTEQYRFNVSPTMKATAFERLTDVGIDNVADLLEGLADGTLRIISKR